MAHALLVLPSANRVYANDGPRLLAAELRAVDELALGGRLANIETTTIGGVAYVTFDGDLGDDGVAVVSNLSAAYALFERQGDDGLRPIELRRLDRWPDDLISIQRYPGRTNEQLTRLVLNLALAANAGADAFTGTARPRVLDPLCGRGTTLNVAALCGLDAAGIDEDRKDVDAYLHFFTTWLKDKRAKHSTKRHGVRTTIEFAPDKAAPKQEVVVASGDTTDVVKHLGKSSVDVLVTDLPYGVQHRPPRDLLRHALPTWKTALRPGGAMGLAWSTKSLPRADVEATLQDAGLTIRTGEGFAHRVDQAIDRDVVVATRPGPARPTA